MDLNLHLVRYLVTVVDEGHFGRAAARLYVSGPALSKQIRALERTLGVQLLDRRAHPVVPTEAGRRFVIEAREALAAADRAVTAIEVHRREQSGVLRVGFVTAATGTHLRRVLAQMQRDAPAVSVQLTQLPWSEQADAVRRGTVDASLVRPPVVGTEELRLDLVRYETRVVALPTTHRLATQVSVALGDLDDDAHVTDDRADPRWVRWWACDPRPSGRPVRYGPVAHSMDELLEIVASGQAISITGSAVTDSYRHPEVVFLPILDLDPSPLSLCTRASDETTPVLALRQAMRAVRAGGGHDTPSAAAGGGPSEPD